MNPQSDTSLPSDSAQARRSPQSRKMTESSHSQTWKGKMTAGAKKLGLPLWKKPSDDTTSLQTMTETVPESSYTYKKPEGSTLMSLEEESSPTEAMKYVSQVQHQKQLKESGYDQMPGAMWEAAAAAQIVQTPEVPGQQTSIASGPGESPLWPEAAQQWKAIEATSSIGGTLDTITEEENPIPLQLPRLSGAQTPYYPDDKDPWGEQTDTNKLLEQHPHADSPPWERRILFADTNEEDTVLWWFTGAQSLARTTDVSNLVETELNQADLADWPHCRYGSTEIPISYDMNPSSTQPIISTDWTCGLEPGYKSTGSPMRENMQTKPPSMRRTMSLSRDPAIDPTDEELYRMNWDQFWWHTHDKLLHETYWSTTPQGRAYQQAEPGSQLERDILSQETQYIAIYYWNILHPDRQLL
ncbi:uncharacterized protein EV420DRAFT_1488912 [Desarmillaria tabescens]|uniref:Uncharacterized protein n=1 Tax=Armillaria tabescens TaxID=1929756 RepID=A0AA39J274_ARMTA|nr:uncharacterized protein EV420DRAFT_1488912 [Desarmillaria tabescens]KAK0433902.1 hypothetical protein EV420DRAFT_1488912 [Desarmillaria tabescens]